MRSLLLICLIACATSTAGAAPKGLSVNAFGVLMKDGKPYRGIGVNYFNVFARTLQDPKDTSYRQGFQTLAKYKIPFARFMACGYWPVDNALYTKDKKRYFELMDGVVKAAEENKIGLIPDLFWHAASVPDIVGEPMSAWGDPSSKTIAYMRQYTQDMVARYKDSPAIWAWEFSNERNLGMDLPNASENRPAVWPNLGTAKSRSDKDDLTSNMIRTAYREFAKEVRRWDKTRPITSGDAAPRPTAWHQRAELSWKDDSAEQFAEALLGNHPDPMNMLSIHMYTGDGDRFGKPFSAELLLKASTDAAKKSKKPLFVGEFGAGDKLSTDEARKTLGDMLSAIEKTGVPLAALWVYDYSGQDGSWNVTAANDREYQLELISEANKRVQLPM